eukprot:9240129-Alexandrium_andersonii.AAC.1
MSASLVGSEMCIRDSRCFLRVAAALAGIRIGGGAAAAPTSPGPLRGSGAVSYTHLTLPTICSV